MNELSHLTTHFEFFSFGLDGVGLGAAIFVSLLLISFAMWLWQQMAPKLPREMEHVLTPEKITQPLHWRDIAAIELGEDGLPKMGRGSDFLFAALPSLNNTPLTPSLLADLLFERFPALTGEEIELSATKNRDMLLIQINGFVFGLMHRDEKFMALAPEDLADTIKRSYHWQEGAKMMKRQKSHFILAHIGAFPRAAKERLKAAKLMTIIASALIETNQILSVYWSHTGNLYAADFWHNEAQKLVTPQIHLASIKASTIETGFSTAVNLALTDLKQASHSLKKAGQLPYKLWMDIRFRDYGDNNKLASIAGLDLFCDAKTGRMAADLDRDEASSEANDFIKAQLKQAPIICVLNQKKSLKADEDYALCFQDLIMP